jgi:hypothetical protein
MSHAPISIAESGDGKDTGWLETTFRAIQLFSKADQDLPWKEILRQAFPDAIAFFFSRGSRQADDHVSRHPKKSWACPKLHRLSDAQLQLPYEHCPVG